MPARRKNNPTFIATKTSVRAHHRTVYKRKTKQKLNLGNFVKKSMKIRRGGGLGAAKSIGSVLMEVAKPVAEGFWNLAKQRAAAHKEAIRRFYYYNN